MKKIALILLVSPLFANAQLKLHPYLTGGYFNDMVRQDYKQYNRLTGFPTASTKGFYAGLGLNAKLPVIPVGLQLEGAYEKHTLNYYFEDMYRFNGSYQIGIGTPLPPFPTSAAVLKLAPAFTYTRFKRIGFSYGAQLGAAYRLRLTNKSMVDKNYTNLFAGISAGFSAVMLNLSYEYGLTSTLKTWHEVPLLRSYWGEVKSSRLNIGLTIYPTVLLKR